MSFHGYKEFIEEGDTAILYISFNSMQALKVTKEKPNKAGQMIENVVQTSYGALKVADLIGKRFGTKVRLTRGFAFILHPTPQLWTKTLPHRTQILYATDISLIIQQLDLRPGSKVIESGTGSGSLSHSLIRTIAPNGHLYTFDFHQNRVDTAAQEFKDHKIDQYVTSSRRDVCADGFGDELEDQVDAVFLDLPHPWDAVPHAKKCIKKSTGGRICSFSPCVEQVQKAISVMEEQGFQEITTMECLIREFQVRKISLPVFDPDRPVPHFGGKRKAPDDENEDSSENQPDKPAETTFTTGVPLTTMPGHTGYLTFATFPAVVSEK